MSQSDMEQRFRDAVETGECDPHEWDGFNVGWDARQDEIDALRAIAQAAAAELAAGDEGARRGWDDVAMNMHSIAGVKLANAVTAAREKGLI